MGFQVEIFGQTYSLRSEAEEEHVKQVADLVDSRMREVASGSRSTSVLQIAVLAALDIASEFVQKKAEADRRAVEVEARIDALARRIASLDPELYSS